MNRFKKFVTMAAALALLSASGPISALAQQSPTISSTTGGANRGSRSELALRASYAPFLPPGRIRSRAPPNKNASVSAIRR